MKRAVWLGLTWLLACSSSESTDSASDPSTASTASAIVNGTLDTTHSAVVTIIAAAGTDMLDICTGTIVKADVASGTGWVATAAHCITDGAPLVVWEGADYGLKDQRIRHSIVSYAADKRFDINKPANGYDFAVIRIGNVTAATPVIPLATAPDDIALGAAMDNVGFGRTTRPPAEAEGNSKRHIVSTTITQASPLLFGYDSSIQGACQGDSGGPWLVGTGEGMRVIGIDSFGNTTCDGFAFAGRVQAGLDFFNAQLGVAVPEACELCTTLARSSGGKCEKTAAAGVTSCVCTDACVDECKASSQCTSSPTCTGDDCNTAADAGAAETPVTPESDAGPTIVVVHHEGNGCSMGPTSRSTTTSWTILLGLALAWRVRRRRS